MKYRVVKTEGNPSDPGGMIVTLERRKTTRKRNPFAFALLVAFVALLLLMVSYHAQEPETPAGESVTRNSAALPPVPVVVVNNAVDRVDICESAPAETHSYNGYPIVPIPEKVLARMSEPTPEPEPVEEESITYTEEELEMMALVIYQEAGGDACSDDTRLKVGTVVMNRVADERPWLPDTIEEVLLQEDQYGRLHWTGLVWPDRAELPQEAHAVARAYECAARILSGERYLPEDVIFQSENIMGEIVAEQDGFYFCR